MTFSFQFHKQAMSGHRHITRYSGTSDKGHLCIKDTFQKNYGGNTFLPPKEDNLFTMDEMIRPNVSIISTVLCIYIYTGT